MADSPILINENEALAGPSGPAAPRQITKTAQATLRGFLLPPTGYFAAAGAFLVFFFFATGAGPGTMVVLPPAFSIFSLALALKRWAATDSFFVSSPSPSTFSTSNRFLRMPA